MTRLIEELGLAIEPVTAASARRIATAYGRWGRGVHPAGLTLATASPTKSPRGTPARCSMSATILQRPMWRALFEGGETDEYEADAAFLHAAEGAIPFEMMLSSMPAMPSLVSLAILIASASVLQW